MDYPVRLTKGNKDSTSETSDVGVLEHLKLGGLAGTGDRYIGVDDLGNVKKMTTPSAMADGTTFGTAVTDFNSPAPTDGNTNYRNTSTGELWKWDGDKWSVVADYLKLLAFNGAVNLTIANNDVRTTLPGVSFVCPRSGVVMFDIAGVCTHTATGTTLGDYNILRNGVDTGWYRNTHYINHNISGSFITGAQALSFTVSQGDVITFAYQGKTSGATTTRRFATFAVSMEYTK